MREKSYTEKREGGREGGKEREGGKMRGGRERERENQIKFLLCDVEQSGTKGARRERGIPSLLPPSLSRLLSPSLYVG